MINILKKRYLYFTISLIIIIPGLLALIIWGLPAGIDFTGGSLLEVVFLDTSHPPTEEVVQLYREYGFMDAKAQSAGDSNMIVRSRHMDEDDQVNILAEMETRFNADVELQRFERVGPSLGQNVPKQVAGAAGLAALGVMLSITYTFRRMDNAYRYGVAAILALLHDLVLVLGAEAILGHFFGWETDTLFLTALLTVIGFSVHDTLVVFDRIRENTQIYRRVPYETLVNHSIIQTLDRSINTQLMVMFPLFAMALFGGSTIRHFVIILLLGLLSGTCSSIFTAAPILVVWENKEWQTWFKKNPAEAS